MSTWITLENSSVTVYKTEFAVCTETEFRFRFSADEYCDIYLDGEFITRGPERGGPAFWFYNEASCIVTPGNHLLCARVLALGTKSATGQQSIAPGFFFDSELVSTARGDWQALPLDGFELIEPYPDWGAPWRIRTMENFRYDACAGAGDGWAPAVRREDARMLHRQVLPAMRMDEVTGYEVIETAPGRTLIRFREYVNAWGEFVFRGPGRIGMRWCESLYEEPELRAGLVAEKGDRMAWEGKYFIANGDEFTLPADGREVGWRNFWFKAGLFLEIACEGEAQLVSARFFDTGYPVPPLPDWNVTDPHDAHLLKVARRTLQLCSWETFFDCPYFEQLMYVGDSRIEALSLYALGKDSWDLPWKALKFFAATQNPEGMILCRTPSRDEHVIPSFALVFILMLHDFAMWNDRPEEVKSLLPTAERIAGYFLNTLDDRNLAAVPGWVFLDWVKEWSVTCAPPGRCPMNFLLVDALTKLAELERAFGDETPAQKYESAAGAIRKALFATFWVPERGLYADDEEHRFFSEHAQVLAFLAGGEHSPSVVLDGLRASGKLPECGVYFSFYYLEACYRHRAHDLFRKRYERYYAFAKDRFTSLPEHFKHTRSDCHAWSSHVIFHYFASILGRRPSGFGRKAFREEPLLAEGNECVWTDRGIPIGVREVATV